MSVRNSAETFFKDKELLTLPTARAAYSDRTAWMMAECSRAAYLLFENDLSTLDDAIASGGFKRLATFNKKGTQAYLAIREDIAVLAFRGTEQRSEDILTDIKIKFTKTKLGEIHEGFYSAYELIHAEVEAEINKITDRPIYITGHSLGGALATIATWYLDRDNLAACYTFGSPRVGDKNLDMKIKTPVYRVVNAADIVTNIPLVAMKYEHVGSLYYLTPEGNMVRSPSGTRLFFRFFKVIFERLRNMLEHHFIKNYCQKLEKIALQRNVSPSGMGAFEITNNRK